MNVRRTGGGCCLGCILMPILIIGLIFRGLFGRNGNGNKNGNNRRDDDIIDI